MLETALVMPVLLLMLIGIMEFGVRSYNQGRAAMAARHGAWLGVTNRYNSIETEVKKFFAEGADVKVEKAMEDLDLEYHNAAIDYALFAYTTGYTSHSLKKNVKVSLTYSRGKMPYAPPGPSDGLEFLWGKVSDFTVTAARGDTATWQEVDFMTMCWFFLASGVWLDVLLNLGIDLIIDGIFEQFGEIGKIFSSVVYEIILRLTNIPALKCD